ncbi:MAG: aminoglycoside phosphotransferase [Candidatus Hydrogenedentota bacterium]|nr:MAG: aminoglycoside phosphotransferase [Candidatus Hydrogenedentota bacterium]
MTLRESHIADNPEFPWLEAADVDGISTCLNALGWLESGERIVTCDKAGEGNMNLTLRVVTNLRSVILKQARPWVEKYDTIPAPWDRCLFEQRFYERVQVLPAVADHMPKLLAADGDAKLLLLEDLGEAADYTDLYADAALHEPEIAALAKYLSTLHAGTRSEPDPAFANREMRALNYEHIFVIPLATDNGLDVDAFEPGLSEMADKLRDDAEYMEWVRKMGDRYLADGPCLLHGDFFPGSWLYHDGGVKVIDPEFCFYGDPEFDLGVWLAHICLADQDESVFKELIGAYSGVFDSALTVRYAAVEIMRRLLGVAQLPIPVSDGTRSRLLEKSRHAMITGEIEVLWSFDSYSHLR